MRLPGTLDATVRYFVVTGLGLLVLAVVPASVLGPAPLWRLPGRSGPTAANLLAVALIIAAWLYLSLIVGRVAVAQPDAAARVLLAVSFVGLVVFVLTASSRLDAVSVGSLAVATAAQVGISWRVARVGVRIAASEPEVPAGLK